VAGSNRVPSPPTGITASVIALTHGTLRDVTVERGHATLHGCD
jgi:hypothetical protein